VDFAEIKVEIPRVVNITYLFMKRMSGRTFRDVVAALHKTIHGWCDKLTKHRVLLRV
jgi:hypothetical protein